jgi:hypothetical protein
VKLFSLDLQAGATEAFRRIRQRISHGSLSPRDFVSHGVSRLHPMSFWPAHKIPRLTHVYRRPQFFRKSASVPLGAIGSTHHLQTQRASIAPLSLPRLGARPGISLPNLTALRPLLAPPPSSRRPHGILTAGTKASTAPPSVKNKVPRTPTVDSLPSNYLCTSSPAAPSWPASWHQHEGLQARRGELRGWVG